MSDVALQSWAKPSRQTRSQATLERILQAATELMEKKRFADINVGEIARKAKVSVGSFYARFPDKDALLGSLHQRFCDEVFATIERFLAPNLWSRAGAADIIRAAIPFLIGIYVEHRILMRELSIRVRTDPRFPSEGQRMFEEMAARLRPLMEERAKEIKHPDLETAIRFGLTLVLSTVDQKILFEDPDPQAQSALSEELTRAVLGYVGIPNR